MTEEKSFENLRRYLEMSQGTPSHVSWGGGMLGYFVGGLVTGVREWIKLERRNEEIV